MNSPMTSTETDPAGMRAEIDVLRLMVALLIGKKIDREHAPVFGADMAGVVEGLAGPDGSPDLHLEAFTRFCDSVREAAGGDRLRHL